jgi:type II secretion system protein G
MGHSNYFTILRQYSRKYLYLRSGFTLIELLSVIAIVGILAVGLVTVINPLEQVAKGRDTKRKADLAMVQKALEVYYSDNGAYPSSANGQMVNASGVRIGWGTNGFQPYLPLLPADGTSGRSYAYLSTGQSYWLYASLQRGGKDPSACNAPNNTVCQNATGVSCGNGICNYGVSSPNTSP